MEANKKEKKANSAIIIGIILAIMIIVLLIFFLRGETTTTGNYPENYSDKSLVCVGNDIDYPIFTYDNSTKKEMKINLLFSQDEIRSIALVYSLYYNDASSIDASETQNHAAMNISYGKNGLEADALNAKYAKLNDRVQMNLYATSSQMNNVVLRYFLIDGDYALKTLEEYQTFYESKNMQCEIK